MSTVPFRQYSADVSDSPALFLGVDTKSGSLFCSECENFIYDAEVDELYLSTTLMVEEKQTHFQGARNNFFHVLYIE